MPLLLAPVKESDLEELGKIEIASFSASSILSPLIWPNGGTQAAIDVWHQSHKERFAFSENFYWKVVDTDLNSKIIAFAAWRVVRQDETPSKPGRLGFRSTDTNPDVNHHIFEAFLDSHNDVRDNVIAGRKRVHLSILATDPKHQRRGAATMLLKKGAEIAGQEQLESWLIATRSGEHVYRKVGFERVEGGSSTFDLAPYGGQGTQVDVVMMRPLEKKAASA
ncbi:hypothetical protein MMC10_004813 [Thelotrema lepadinum]|nr:hypothetical protein [Thelotrema lepadinum]